MSARSDLIYELYRPKLSLKRLTHKSSRYISDKPCPHANQYLTSSIAIAVSSC
jgi:hypothetical protein